MTTTDEIISTIVSGHVDASLEVIVKAIRMRRENLNDSKVLLLKPGDEVRFNTQANPKYLEGITATVKKVNRKTVNVDIPDNAYGARKFRGARDVRTPIAIVDKV